MNLPRLLASIVTALCLATIAAYTAAHAPFTPAWTALCCFWLVASVVMWTFALCAGPRAALPERFCVNHGIELYGDEKCEYCEAEGKDPRLAPVAPHGEYDPCYTLARPAMEPCPDGEHYFPFPQELGADPENYPGVRFNCACGAQYTPELAGEEPQA